MTIRFEGTGSVGQVSAGGQVTATELPDRPGQRGDHAIELRVAPSLENLAMLRTLVGAVGTFEDLDVDTVADLRLAVDEVGTRLIRCAAADATLVVVVDPRADDVVVEASAACQNPDVVTSGSFSWHVLTSLTDDVQTFGDGKAGGVFGITLTTRRASITR